MGLNVIVQTVDGLRHPSWDDGRYGGDREFARLIYAMPHENRDIGDPYDCEFVTRPTDFAALREHIPNCENPARWSTLLDILEHDPEWWLFFSY